MVPKGNDTDCVSLQRVTNMLCRRLARECNGVWLSAILRSYVVQCREPLAITVSATDQNDSRVWAKAGTGANYGSCVDIWAPGNATLSASNASDNATE